MMRSLIVVFFLMCLVIIQVKADHVTVNGKKLTITTPSPFYSYPRIARLREKLKAYATDATDDDCSFSAEWKVINKRLILNAIHSCDQYAGHILNANLNSLFGKRSKQSSLIATWFTGKIWLTADTPIAHPNINVVVYQRETCLDVIKGIVISIKNYNYPKPIISIYYKNSDSLNSFIYTHIQWDRIEHLPPKDRPLLFLFRPDTTGQPFDIKFDPSYPESAVIDTSRMQEAKRVISLLRWPVYYEHGELFKNYGMGTSVSIIFSKEMMNKYNSKH